MSTECEHKYVLVAAMDGCHWYKNHFRCTKCGDKFVQEGERSTDDDYLLMWLDATCRGCRDLAEKSGKSLSSLENYDSYMAQLEESSEV